jgi:hypothetical protein
MAVDYSEHMGYVDQADRNAVYAEYPHRHQKWTHVLLFWLMKASIGNARIIYNHLHPENGVESIEQFTYELAKEMRQRGLNEILKEEAKDRAFKEKLKKIRKNREENAEMDRIGEESKKVPSSAPPRPISALQAPPLSLPAMVVPAMPIPTPSMPIQTVSSALQAPTMPILISSVPIPSLPIYIPSVPIVIPAMPIPTPSMPLPVPQSPSPTKTILHNNQVHELRGGFKQTDCSLCYKNKIRSKTSKRCIGCNKALHDKCFEAAHPKPDLHTLVGNYSATDCSWCYRRGVRSRTTKRCTLCNKAFHKHCFGPAHERFNLSPPKEHQTRHPKQLAKGKMDLTYILHTKP